MKGIYYLNDAMNYYKKKIEVGSLNLINSQAGSGKSTFVFNDLLNDTKRYIDGAKYKLPLKHNLHKVLYVCDTSMLQDSILTENIDIAIKLEKGGLKEAKDYSTIIKHKNGKVKVITYSTLGFLLKEDCNKYIIQNWFDLVIFDEVHNLFSFLYKYEKKGNATYRNVVNNLRDIYKKTACIALSATPNKLLNYSKYQEEFKIRKIFNQNELDTIRCYNFDPMYTNCIMNQIKTYVNAGLIHNDGHKILIYTNTIKKAREYKKWLMNRGIKTEWLCSINNKTELKYTDENGREIVEKIPTMNNYQLSIRDRLLKGINDKHDLKGTLPDDLTVLIVNGGYETGWNLYDENVQIALIDDVSSDTHVQARNRIRHDIKYLFVKTKLYNGEGCVLEKGKYGELYEKSYTKNGTSYLYLIRKYLIKNVDDKYLGVKMTPELKAEMVDNYGLTNLYGKNNFSTLCDTLIESGYKVEKDKHSTYIFKAGEEVRKDNRKEVKNMNDVDNLKYWLLNEWDKKRVTVSDVMDATDFGRKSWDKVVKDDDIIQLFTENRIKIGTIKGLGTTKYMFKY